ncbi:MAG: SGNH/GDSL hydrolase family protein [Coprococcus sp.]|nr:SGNH/GDSL hydrolase family protein [Coprococcus sp.]
MIQGMRHVLKIKYICMAAVILLLGMAFSGCGKNENVASEEQISTIETEHSDVANADGDLSSRDVAVNLVDEQENDDRNDDRDDNRNNDRNGNENDGENAISDGANPSDKTGQETTDGEQQNMKIYVAIGDSLTHGYGLADKKNDRFSAIVTENLNKAGDFYVEYNYGVDGLTTDGLLDMLEQGGIGMISEADLITIDIGANDVLDSMNPIIYATIENGSVTKEKYEQALSNYQNSLLSGYENTKAVLEFIKEKNPDCQIVIATIYNPYRYIDLDIIIEGENTALSDFTDSMMQELNENIKALANEYDCRVADWYTAFAMTKLNVLNARYDETVVNLDIHPNKEGYNLMATVVYEAIAQ